MGLIGWATGGASGFGPSSAYSDPQGPALPWKGYREIGTWLEEWVDAIGIEFDIRNVRFLRKRAQLLDPTYTPTEAQDNNLATATQPPLLAAVTDTMLDVLLYIAGIPWPVDSNLSIAQKQALVAIGWAALRRKGNRRYLLALAAAISDGIAVGWTVPPSNFSIILPDGAPSPGYGSWVPATNAIAATSRPWILPAVRNVLARITPIVNLGVGYSQFRAGYSSAGETVFPAGARINILTHEHFDTWGGGVPTGWTKTGTATLTQSTSATSINWEFTGNAAVLDLTAATRGQSVGLSQGAAAANNQLTHRLQLDYAYTNTQGVSTLLVQVYETNADGNTYYYNSVSNAWQTTAYNIAVPVSATRGRFAIDVVPQPSSPTSSACGTVNCTIAISATCDGTATTQTTYTLYRVGLYEKFSLAVEQASSGERTAWYPLVDAPGWTFAFRTGVPTIIEPASADRSSYKVFTNNNPTFPMSAALNGRGLLSTSTWTNLLKGSNDFITDWVVSSTTHTANSVISPRVGETSPSAVLVTATANNGILSQQLSISPTSKTFCGGVWMKKISTDAALPTISIVMLSNITTNTLVVPLKQSQGWQLIPFNFTFAAGDAVGPTLEFVLSASGGQIALANAYLYDVTGKTGVLYPPVVQSLVGSTATLNPTTCKALASSTDTNVLHPLTQRTLQSVVRGAMALTIAPMFDASSQPNAVIFDLAQGAAQNRVALRVNSGALELHRWDNAGNQWTASLTMSANAAPGAGSMTWLRDTAISIRCIWDENSTMLGAGNGNASGVKPGSWAPSDASVAFMRFGCDLAGATQFDGQFNGVEQLQLGAPTT